VLNNENPNVIVIGMDNLNAGIHHGSFNEASTKELNIEIITEERVVKNKEW
jgi:hypothetical protein